MIAEARCGDQARGEGQPVPPPTQARPRLRTDRSGSPDGHARLFGTQHQVSAQPGYRSPADGNCCCFWRALRASCTRSVRRPEWTTSRRPPSRDRRAAALLAPATRATVLYAWELTAVAVGGGTVPYRPLRAAGAGDPEDRMVVPVRERSQDLADGRHAAEASRVDSEQRRALLDGHLLYGDLLDGVGNHRDHPAGRLRARRRRDRRHLLCARQRRHRAGPSSSASPSSQP